MLLIKTEDRWVVVNKDITYKPVIIDLDGNLTFRTLGLHSEGVVEISCFPNGEIDNVVLIKSANSCESLTELTIPVNHSLRFSLDLCPL